MTCILHFPGMPTPKRDNLPNRVRYWREQRGLSLRSLAEIIGCGHATLAKIERGEIEFGQYWMERLGKVLEVTPADLLLPETGGLTPEERAMIQTYREVPEANRRMIQSVMESQQGFRGAPETVELNPSRRDAG